MPVSTTTYSIIGITPIENPQDARAGAGVFKASVTIARGTVLAVLTATKKFEAYASGGSGGTETAVGICMYDIITDSSGNVFFGNSSTATEINVPCQTAPYWSAGTFKTGELIGYSGSESDVLGDLNAHLNGNGNLVIP